MSRWGPAALASGVDLDGLKNVLQSGARMLDLPDETVTVLTLTGDEHLREYNRRYRGLDEPTDVLAFAAQEKAGSSWQPAQPSRSESPSPRRRSRRTSASRHRLGPRPGWVTS